MDTTLDHDTFEQLASNMTMTHDALLEIKLRVVVTSKWSCINQIPNTNHTSLSISIFFPTCLAGYQV